MNRLLAWMVVLLTTTAFTPARPRIRYSIENQTNQSISTVLQLESADRSFLQVDTTEVRDDLMGEFVSYAHNRSAFKPYIKLLIQTNERQYSTPVFLYEGRCAAYTIRLSERNVSVRGTIYYQLRSQVVRGLIVILIVFVLKGVPFALIVQPTKIVYAAFWVVNGALAVALLFFPPWLLPTFTSVAYLLLASFIVESLIYYRFSSSAQQRNQLIAASLAGNLLCLPGQLISLIAQALFGGC